MKNAPLLTLAIPTFNRINSLRKTIDCLSNLRDISDIELLIIDNCSDDGSWQWLRNNLSWPNVRLERNPYNLGIEGNIIQCLMHASGKYIWLISDHMHLHWQEVINLTNKLRNGLEFTFGYARISQYDSVLDSLYTPTRVDSVSGYRLGKLLFFLGNISAFIVSREHIAKCGRLLFRFSGYSYPHLGAFMNVSGNGLLLETGCLSKFLGQRSNHYRISYDTFRSRFIGFVRAIKEISKHNMGFRGRKVRNGALGTRSMVASLASESMAALCFRSEDPVKPSEFGFCIRHYPGKIRLFLLPCCLLSLFPQKQRMLMAKMLFKTFFLRKYNMLKHKYTQQFSSDAILE